jgi:hypothetical protein
MGSWRRRSPDRAMCVVTRRPCRALARSRLCSRTVISRKACCPLSRRAFAPGLATGFCLRLLRWWFDHLQLRRTGCVCLTCRSAGGFRFWLDQARGSDGHRQRCDVIPAWTQLHIRDNRSAEAYKRPDRDWESVTAEAEHKNPRRSRRRRHNRGKGECPAQQPPHHPAVDTRPAWKANAG